MSEKQKSRRRYQRYESDVRIQYHFAYDVETKVKYHVIKGQNQDDLKSQTYSAVSKNISANGICFVCDQRLEQGKGIHLEVFLPRMRKPVCMEGTIRWSQVIDGGRKDSPKYETGVHLDIIEGKMVDDSIHMDEQYQLEWSEVLESILGKYRVLAQKRQKD